MLTIVKTIFYFGPLLFGLGFLAPLISQVILALNWTMPFGLSPLIAGLALGGTYGLLAQLTGRWL